MSRVFVSTGSRILPMIRCGGATFFRGRFAVLVSRSRQLTPERMRAATKDGVGPIVVAIEVLDTDSLFSTGRYSETVAAQFMSHLKNRSVRLPKQWALIRGSQRCTFLTGK